MSAVLRSDGMRFVIYVDDHEPAHVHVIGDGEARIDIAAIRALSNRRMSRRDPARALEILEENRTMLIRRWKEIHG